jgi:hypothetical protein
MTSDERAAQIELAVKKIVALRAKLAREADTFKNEIVMYVRDGSYHEAAVSTGNWQAMEHAQAEVAIFHDWFLSQFEADL